MNARITSLLSLVLLFSIPAIGKAYPSPFWNHNRCVDVDNTIRKGDRLYPGEHVCSGSYVFGVDHNGILGVWFDTSRVTDRLWHANSSSQKAAYLKMQGDGNLILRGPGGESFWSSGTYGNPKAKFVLEEDVATIKTNNGKVIWQRDFDDGTGFYDETLKFDEDTAVCKSQPLHLSGKLFPGQYICFDFFYFGMDQDGDLSLWSRDPFGDYNKIWSAGTEGDVYATMQMDGNLVVYERFTKENKWDAETADNLKAQLILTKNGVAKIKTVDGITIWTHKDGKTGTQSNGKNLVKNGSFEKSRNGSQSDPKHWKTNDHFRRSYHENVKGRFSLALTAGSEIVKPAYQKIFIEPNTDYELSVWMRIARWTKGPWAVVFDTDDKFDEKCQFLGEYGQTGDWIKHSCRFNSGNRQEIKLRMFTEYGFEGTCYFDDIELVEKNPHHRDCRIEMGWDTSLSTKEVTLQVKDTGNGFYIVTDRMFTGNEWSVDVQLLGNGILDIDAGVPDITYSELLDNYEMKDDRQLTFYPVSGYTCNDFDRSLIYFLIEEWFYFG